MPTYQYRCTECGHDLEAVQKFSDPTLSECPNCGGQLRKVFNAVGVVFKGSGFYRTDSRKAEGGSDSSDSATSSSKSETKTGSSSSTESSGAGSKSESSGSSKSESSAGTGGSTTTSTGSSSTSSKAATGN